MRTETYPVSISVRHLSEKDPRRPEWDTLQQIGNDAISSVMSGLKKYTSGCLALTDQQETIIKPELQQMEGAFLTNLMLSNVLAIKTYQHQGRPNSKRVSADNESMKKRLDEIRGLSHKTSLLWMGDRF